MNLIVHIDETKKTTQIMTNTISFLSSWHPHTGAHRTTQYFKSMKDKAATHKMSLWISTFTLGTDRISWLKAVEATLFPVHMTSRSLDHNSSPCYNQTVNKDQ